MYYILNLFHVRTMFVCTTQYLLLSSGVFHCITINAELRNTDVGITFFLHCYLRTRKNTSPIGSRGIRTRIDAKKVQWPCPARVAKIWQELLKLNMYMKQFSPFYLKLWQRKRHDESGKRAQQEFLVWSPWDKIMPLSFFSKYTLQKILL